MIASMYNIFINNIHNKSRSVGLTVSSFMTNISVETDILFQLMELHLYTIFI